MTGGGGPPRAVRRGGAPDRGEGFSVCVGAARRRDGDGGAVRPHGFRFNRNGEGRRMREERRREVEAARRGKAAGRWGEGLSADGKAALARGAAETAARTLAFLEAGRRPREIVLESGFPPAFLLRLCLSGAGARAQAAAAPRQEILALFGETP